MSPYVAMAHSNAAKVENGLLEVDRKFHVGMVTYAQQIRSPLITLNPAGDGAPIMDPVTVPIKDLPYAVVTVKVGPDRKPVAAEFPMLRKLIGGATLVYGDGLATTAIARSTGVPYIPILEYDLATQVTVATANVRNPVRRGVKSARIAWNYRKGLRHLEQAHSVHCNGYPIFDATRVYNSNTLLYLDSRMSGDMVIPEDALDARLSRTQKPLRLLYSGRFEPMKGANDAVQVAVECLRRGLDIEMHCYGQGSLKSQMQATASHFPDRIFIHDSVPYAELVDTSRGFDVFVCCHIQNDPSCTYLESFGAGLAIVGYANRMWQRLRDESQGGIASPMGKPAQVADGIASLIAHRDELAAMSRSARRFALEHCYENEFAKRIDALNEAVSGLAPRT